MEYHLYKRTVNGKKVWYYWYSENGKQIRKSCKAKTKKDAEIYLEKLKANEENIKILENTVTVSLVAADMFRPDSTYLKLLNAYGHKNSDATLKSKIRTMNQYIIPEFGDRNPVTIESCEITNWILSINVSNSYRNFILGILFEILTECKRLAIIQTVPEIKKFVVRSKKKDIFSDSELMKLFPDDLKAWETIYGSKADFYLGVDSKFHDYGFMFGLVFYTMLCTGMRPGEVRAMTVDQIKGNAIVLNKSISQETVVNHLKKGTDDNPRFRVSIMPSKLNQLINYWLTIRPVTECNCLFAYRDDFIPRTTIQLRFNSALMRTGICEKLCKKDSCGNNVYYPDKKRKLSPHSLRFTYNSKIVYSNLIPGETLRQMMGHLSATMTDYYTRSDIDREISGLLQYQKLLDKIF